MRRRRKHLAGLTLIELIVAFTILLLLTTMALPLTRFRVRREREKELRRALIEMRTAIDKYKDACDYGQIAPDENKLDSDCYPADLEILIKGVKASGAVDKKIKFLRRIPKDPFTGQREWGMRSSKDDPTSTSWGGQNVFDVYTKTFDKAPDGTPYAEW
ncbi:MAG: prepilin-type N-terminal cleavage/methylation domain-containing protein [Bryobacteraceae bacterium]